MDKHLTFGKYQTIELLGRGGFATVYKAKNTILGNEVALKVLDAALASDETFVQRFLQEAQQTVRLDHPNIMRVLDLDKTDDKLFIVMEYVPGRNLRDWLADNSLSLDQIANIIRQTAAALDFAHSRQIIHRDVKPSNIMIRNDGKVKLADFGIAKAAAGAKLTLTGTTIGTPVYMSPEQSRGAKLDGRSDIYSLGIIAFELITGQVPFQGDTASVIYKQIHEQPPLPSTFTARAKGPLEPALLKALAKAPTDRYQTGKDFANALDSAVMEVQTMSLAQQYDKTVVLVNNYQFDDAIRELEALNAINPGYQNVSDLLKKARQGLQLSQQYQEAANHLSAARKLVETITAVDPNFPDSTKVIQTFHSQESNHTAQQVTWFWVGAAAVTAAYLSTTWVWVTASVKLAETNIIEETRAQMEGLAALFSSGIPWIIWPPLLCAALAVLLTVLPARLSSNSSKARPPVDQTRMIKAKKGKRPFPFIMVAKWIILLAGLISAIFLIASVHNLVGPITIAVGIAIMLLADIRQFLKSR